MAKKNLHKSKGNFTIKRLHQSGGYGNIYERDYSTIIPSISLSNGQLPIYNGPSLKLTVGNGINEQKKYRHGKWLANPNNCSDTNAWTLGCMPAPNSNDSKINLKPSKSQITDYVCYGSTYELIRASLDDIINRFPAEIYVSNKTLKETGLLDLGDMDISSELYQYKEIFENYKIVENPLNIDILQAVLPEKNKKPILKYFCESQYDYVVMDENDNIIIDGSLLKQWNEEHPYELKNWWVVSYEPDKDCLLNGDKLATVSFLKYNSEISDHDVFMKIICFYYDGDILYLSDIENNYKIRPNKSIINDFFDSLDDFEKLLLNRHTNYTANFDTYLENEDDGWYMTQMSYQWPLDEGGWNLAVTDLPYSKYINALSKLAIGYDTLYTDAIWNDMTHEAINNMDLTEKMTNDYETVYNPAKMRKFLNVIGRQFDEIKKYIDNIKSTNIISYDEDKNMPDYFISDALELCGWETKHILNNISDEYVTNPIYGSHNLGFKASDANNEFMKRLKLNSKNIFASKGTKRCIEDLLAVFGFHSTDWIKKYYENPKSSDFKKSFLMNEYVYVTNGYQNDPENIDEIVQEVKRINQLKDSYSNDYINGFDNVDYYQGLPITEATFNGKTRLVPWFEKEKNYDDDLYFQMKGGWSRNDGNKQNDIGKYENTITKIHTVNKLSELYELIYALIKNDDIYYVYGENKYYKLIDKDKHRTSDGWVLLDDDEIFELESVIDDNRGNNPHRGEYDGGSSYLETIKSFFKKSVFSDVDENEVINRDDYGFKIELQNDNMKTLFLGENNQNPEIEFDDDKDNAILRGNCNINPYNLFTGENEITEASSLSVINNKMFHIVFDISHRSFIENDILPYLKQVIPSTTIFSYSFEDIENYDPTNRVRKYDVVCSNKQPINGVV